MNLIFLDFDGVLNNHKAFPNGYCGLDSDMVIRLGNIMNAVPELKIVISSAWRYMILNGDITLRGFQNLLLLHGIDYSAISGRIIGHTHSDKETCRRYCTPQHSLSIMSDGLEIRKLQILDWIGDNLKRNDSVKFAVLDDLPIDLPELFQTDPYVGLDEDTARSIIEYFNMPELSTAQVRK